MTERTIRMEILKSGFPAFDTPYQDTVDFYTAYFERELNGYIAELGKESAGYNKLSEAMSYSLSAGGKRIRPMLAYEFCRVCGGNISDATPAALAIEMIHTFSLIHDDLPCMDDDDMRRGKPSCHKAYDEATALLAGDALTIDAFYVLASSELSPEKVKKMVRILSDCSYKMTGGQVLDIGGDIEDTELLLRMYSYKTSQLIIAASLMGCIAAGADEQKQKSAYDYAYSLGLAFQIIDDILDVTSDKETLGKPVGSDEKQNKNTTVTLMGLDNARKLAEEYTEKAILSLECFDNNQFLMALTNKLLGRKK